MYKMYNLLWFMVPTVCKRGERQRERKRETKRQREEGDGERNKVKREDGFTSRRVCRIPLIAIMDAGQSNA